MALVSSLATLLAVGLFAVIAAGFGSRLLLTCGLEFASDAEHLLCSITFGVICFEILLFPAQLPSHARIAVVIVTLLFAAFGLLHCPPLFPRASRVVQRMLKGSSLERALITLTAAVLLVEGLAAMAPLTGSDALHYHFTAPLLILRSGFHPDFFLSYSLLSGQTHLLILMALALGSDKLAMGLLFLGGVLAAAAGACLARRWTGREWSWLVALVFLLTPVVFWQISSAGAPDLWMAAFATVAVIVISRAAEFHSSAHISHALLAGALAGAVAGTKYTGCIVAASLAVAYFLEARAVSRWMMFMFAALCAGVWPYARNFAWTRDPSFPFLMPWISPGRVNQYTLHSILADTGAADHRTFFRILEFPLFAAIDPAHLGFWQFLGPIVLAFAPLLVLTIRNTAAWRAALTVWILSALAIGASSGMTRFALPVFPIALAAVLAGAAHTSLAGLRKTHYVAAATLGVLLASGAAGLLVYERAAVSAAVGLTSREIYLRDHAPEYQDAEVINQVLAGKESQGKVLVFLRHTYYLRVPFLYGDPTASWAVDPAKFQTPEEWRKLFRENGIRWVVRSPVYPPAIAAPLNALEAGGTLVPIAQSDVSDFHGMRMSNDRQRRSVVILAVID